MKSSLFNKVDFCKYILCLYIWRQINFSFFALLFSTHFSSRQKSFFLFSRNGNRPSFCFLFTSNKFSFQNQAEVISRSEVVDGGGVVLIEGVVKDRGWLIERWLVIWRRVEPLNLLHRRGFRFSWRRNFICVVFFRSLRLFFAPRVRKPTWIPAPRFEMRHNTLWHISSKTSFCVLFIRHPRLPLLLPPPPRPLHPPRPRPLRLPPPRPLRRLSPPPPPRQSPPPPRHRPRLRRRRR